MGQIANAAAIELTRQGKANVYCLAGMGAHITGMMDSAAHANYRIVIDGCPVACARKTLEHAGIRIDKAIVVTALGIPKNHRFVWSDDELQRVVQTSLEGTPQIAQAEGDGFGCCCEDR